MSNTSVFNIYTSPYKHPTYSLIKHGKHLISAYGPYFFTNPGVVSGLGKAVLLRSVAFKLPASGLKAL